MVPGWSPTKIVQMVLIGCLCRSWGQKIGLQNATFKNLFVWNYKAQSFHVWYIASSRGPLPKLFKLCPWGQNWPHPGGHNFTLNYIRKISNDFLSWTSYGNFWSSTNIWWTTLVVLCKWLYLDPWPFPQVSDLGPFGPSCWSMFLLKCQQRVMLASWNFQ